MASCLKNPNPAGRENPELAFEHVTERFKPFDVLKHKDTLIFVVMVQEFPT